MRRAFLFLPLLASCAPGTNNFSTTQSISVTENMPEGFAPWTDAMPPYRFGPGDKVKVQYLLTPEINETVLVAPDGSIALRTGVRLTLDSRTGEEASEAVAEASRRVLMHPFVTVSLDEPGAAVAFVGGMVRRAGAYPVTGRRGIAEMITLAGGLEDSARMDQVVLIRRSPENRPMLRTVDLRGFISGRGTEADVPLTAGDIVFVPRSRIAEVGLWVTQAITQTFPFSRSFSYAINRNNPGNLL
ncbi:polysaccharide biosynthesis/export family protein [Roseococcus pinisoli]|uniref:Polysaccharide biosynthesis/export family protein n=1 Tax=Roseococcus pinisoli TaxID=2835040 RepID=A0ABS5QFP6_9PROT|nr:polysaccharide biosynthesis/export family protein [Roseococcus pinisoli]MBS7811747.1 polysaccharide biosynthesis/export family protein [Roseococcus pinisoli]